VGQRSNANDVVPIDFLLGQKLCAVTFVWEYYQFLVGTNTLSIYSHPQVFHGAMRVKHRDIGFRDALCARIGSTISRADSTADILVLEFSDNARIEISLHAEDRIGHGSESLVISDPAGGMMVIGDE
jgi:hypothetical protein